MFQSNAQMLFAIPTGGEGWEERVFRPLLATEFLEGVEGEEMEWVLEDYLPTGSLALPAAKPKVGKSTLAYALAVKVTQGLPFLGRNTKRGGVLILALEEHSRDVRLRLKGFGTQLDNLYIHTGHLSINEQVLSAI